MSHTEEISKKAYEILMEAGFIRHHLKTAQNGRTQEERDVALTNAVKCARIIEGLATSIDGGHRTIDGGEE